MSKKIFPLIFITAGVVLLGYTWQPIINWQFFQKPALIKKLTLLSPLAISENNPPPFLPKDYPPNSKDLKTPTNSGNLSLTIEKFGIKNAKVATGENFLTQLAHWPGTALPGVVGNAMIVGHSTLPQFFQPENYWSIFSKLYLLEIGDRVIVESNNQTFTYWVTETLVVKPEDTWVFANPDSFGSYLTLLTCGVGGLASERIVVRAILSGYQKLV